MEAIKQKVKEIFKKNNLTYDYEVMNDKAVSVTIYWGDWKHDHLCLEQIMKQEGLSSLGHDVTEEDGSDCYSAIHYFMLNK